MPNAAHAQAPLHCRFRLTAHAALRMARRSISAEAVHMTLLYGRVIDARGAETCVIGRNEVRRLAREGIDLSPHMGVHVVCSPDGAILTVYRDREMQGSLASRRSCSPRRLRRRSPGPSSTKLQPEVRP